MRHFVVFMLCMLLASLCSAQSQCPGNVSTQTSWKQVQQMPGWVHTHSGTGGGGGGHETYYMEQYQLQPSLSGNSAEIFIQSHAGEQDNVLFWQSLGSHQGNSYNFNWDFWFMVDSDATNNAQALEFDLYQYYNCYKYQMGSQCDTANHTCGANACWDLWDQTSGWVYTNKSCLNLIQQPNTWHHIQWLTHTDIANTKYYFDQLTVDGQNSNLPVTSYSATYINPQWTDDLGIDVQIDAKQNSGSISFHEWFDQMGLTLTQR